MRRFFCGEGFVAYAAVGRAWVAAAFVEAARRARCRPRFFGVSGADAILAGGALGRTRIGEEPFWAPARWPETLRTRRSLREQLRRARAKGVAVRRVDGAAMASPRAGNLVARWLGARRMAPMGFLVQLDPLRYAAERLYFAAERGEQLVGLLVASPIHATGGWLVEHLLRDPEAPNGTAELLVDACFRHAAARGCGEISLGHVPLAGPVPPPLRLARRLGRRLYNFDGLRAFKAKLRPQRWEPLYLAYPAGERGVLAMLDVLRAFAPGGLLRFGLRTAGHLLLPARVALPPRAGAARARRTPR